MDELARLYARLAQLEIELERLDEDEDEVRYNQVEDQLIDLRIEIEDSEEWAATVAADEVRKAAHDENERKSNLWMTAVLIGVLIWGFYACSSADDANGAPIPRGPSMQAHLTDQP